MKKTIILLLAAALLASLSACHTAEPAPESSQPVPSSSEPVSSLPESSVPASEPYSAAETSAPSPEAVSSRAEAPVSSQAPPPASSNAPKSASSQAPKPPTSSTPPPASSEAEPAPVELPEELKPYRRPLNVDRIIADMVQAGEELGMTYDESLSVSRNSYYPPDDSGNYKTGDEQIFRSNSREGVTFLWRYFQEVEPDALPEQVHFCPYFEADGTGEYLIYVFYG